MSIKRIKLSVWFNLFILAAFVAAAAAFIILVNRHQRRHGLAEAEAKARIILDHNLAIHFYYTHILKPKLFELTRQVRPSDYFEPSWMSSSFAVRRINKYAWNMEGEHYYYKECAINARSPENEADAYEQAFLEELNQNPQLLVRSGVRLIGHKPYLVIMRRGEIMEESCLRCHGRAEQAPAGLVRVYGRRRGFNRRVGEVVSAVSIRVPLSAAYAEASHFSRWLALLVMIILVCLFMAQYELGQSLLFTPIARVRDKASQIAGDKQHLGEKIPLPVGRELSDLTAAFNAMSVSLHSCKQLEKCLMERSLELEKSKHRLTAKNKIADIFFTISDDQMYAEVLQVILELMESKHGLFGYIDQEDEVLVCPSLSTDICRMSNKDIRFPRGMWGGLWGRALVEKKAIYANEPLNTPDGHIFLSRALAVPIIYREELIGEIVVANKAIDYTPEDRALLERLVGYIAPILQARLQRDLQEMRRWQVERKLRAEKDRMQMYLDVTGVMMVVLDQEQRVRLINKKGCEILGYEEKEIINRDWFNNFLSENMRDEVNDIFKKLMSGELELFEYFENPVLTKSGQERIIAWHNAVLHDEKGKIIGLISSGEDITERKRIEESLRQAKEAAEEATRAKSEFLANMSHEIRTPMNGIIGTVDLILDTCLTTEQREYMTMAKTSADCLMSLINDILDFSKIEAGHLTLEKVNFELRTILEAAVEPLIVKAQQKGLELLCHVKPDVPRFLIGDPGRLRQIIINLAGNAIKFTEKGEVAVLCEVEKRDKDSVLLHFTVSDTGIGIPKNKLGIIFESFRQADGSTTRQYGGTGLGLSISQQLAEMIGGSIWAQSKVGQGSIFHFTARFGFQSDKKEDEFINFHGLSILIVDDNDTNRAILQEMASSWGFLTAQAPDGRSALTMLEKASAYHKTPDLVLLDAQMPGLDGFEVSRRIRENPALTGVKIIMLTSLGNCFGRGSGICAYLYKPIRQMELFKAIKEALCGESSSLLKVEQKKKPGRSLKILLAEDDQINQRIGVSMLERRGYSVHLAENGVKALEMLRHYSFDLVLMDVQMPVMDGLEATRVIRSREKLNHIPIIAMTAHVMKDDCERCLAAGMDGYISKPVRLGELEREIENFLPVSPLACSEQETDLLSVFDASSALSNLDGNLRLLKELTSLFLEKAPIEIQKMKEALFSKEAVILERQAHTLKGGSASIGANKFSREAFRLELAARGRDMPRCNLLLERLEEELENFKSVLSSYLH